MKNEYAKIRAASALATFLVVLNAFYLILATDEDLDPSISLAIFIARLTFIFAVFLIWTGRLRRQVAFVFPAPGGDRQLLLSRLSGAFSEFGYRAVDTTAPDHWTFEGKPITPEGKPLNRASTRRTVSIRVDGPAQLRVEGSSVLLREIRKQVSGAVRLPYAGPQPWIARGTTVLGLSVAVVLVLGACISYVSPVIRSMQLARRHHSPAVVTTKKRAGQHPDISPER